MGDEVGVEVGDVEEEFEGFGEGHEVHGLYVFLRLSSCCS